jgi:glycine betaine/choline ABC-type transport system substrate-binding protein
LLIYVLNIPQQELVQAVWHIAPMMSKKVKEQSSEAKECSSKSKEQIEKAEQHSLNWRIDKQHFAEPTASRVFPPGVENYSAGWFAQGHMVWELH